MRVHTLIISTLAVCTGLVAPALGQDLAGTYTTEGRHNQHGSFTGTVSLEAASSPDTYSLRGSHVYGNGVTRTWSGEARKRGSSLTLEITYQRAGAVGNLEGDRSVTARGRYQIVGDDGLKGHWYSWSAWPWTWVSETLTRAPDAAGDGDDDTGGGDDTTPTVEVDLDLVRHNGSVVPESEEQSAGLVVSANIDDDDGDGGAGGDGQVSITSDVDDRDGVVGEDDLIEVRVRKPDGAPDGSSFRLRFGQKLAAWRSKDKTGRVQSESTRIDVAETSLWIEGRAASGAGGETLTLELVKGDKVLGKAEATIHVTHSAFLIVGHGGTGQWGLPRRLNRRAYDGRRNPTITKGKDTSGKTIYWSVYQWETEKEAKIALSTEGAVISYDGHSNFGMGFSFDTHFTKLSQFMNIADAQVPVNWEYLREHQAHPQLMFSEAEYGDDASTSRKFDPVKVSRRVRGDNGTYDTSRYPVSGGNGSRQRLKRGSNRWQDHHYGSTDNIRIVVKAGSRDMPAKRWSALFLNSCYSAQYYADSFGGRGTLFVTHDEASSSSTSAIFLLGHVDGKSAEDILEELNDEEDINDTISFGSP